MYIQNILNVVTLQACYKRRVLEITKSSLACAVGKDEAFEDFWLIYWLKVFLSASQILAVFLALC